MSGYTITVFPSRPVGTVMPTVPALPTVPMVATCAPWFPVQPAWRWTAWPTALRPEIVTVIRAEPPLVVTLTEP